MYFREAMMETLDEIMSGKEIKNIVTTVKKYKRESFFEKRKELKEINKFIEEYKFVKESGTLPHWIPTLSLMPEEILRDLLSFMASKYNCEPYGTAKFIKAENMATGLKKVEEEKDV